VRLFANVDKAQEAKVMAVELNRTEYEHANDLIKAGRFVFDKRDAWSERQPSAQQENDPIAKHGFAEHAKWQGNNDDKHEGTKGRYEFPFGDFEDVYRCGVLSAESRAGHKHHDIEDAAAHLHGMIDALASVSSRGRDADQDAQAWERHLTGIALKALRTCCVNSTERPTSFTPA
jgi:hypothetical protein